jgi:hypothetical protein
VLVRCGVALTGLLAQSWLDSIAPTSRESAAIRIKRSEIYTLMQRGIIIIIIPIIIILLSRLELLGVLSVTTGAAELRSSYA